MITNKNTLIEVYYPIRRLFNPELHFKEYLLKAINDLLLLNDNIKFNLVDNIENVVSIKFVADENLNRKEFVGSIGVLIFKCQTKYNIAAFNQEQFKNQDEFEEFYKSIISYEFQDFIKGLIILSHIAFPGALELTDGNVKIDTEKANSFNANRMITDNRIIIDYIKEIGWPKYNDLSILKVYRWFVLNGFSFHSISKSKIERALAAFSHMFEKNSEFDFDLFWSLMGIEALYCNSKEGISNQIFEKTQIVLGEIKDYKKRLKEMYDFRSRFIHGDIEIPAVYYEPFSSEEDKGFDEKQFQASALAVAILIASIQEMILKDITEFKFKYYQIK